MTDSKDLTPPTKSGKEVIHSIVNGGLSGIPVFGGLSAKLFSLFVVSPYEKRLESWMKAVADKLGADIVRWEDLEGNERFITVFIQCTQAAMRQHHQDKLNLLLNALSNTAQQNYIEEDLESTFVRHIDELTVTHFNMLTFFSENEKELAEIKEYEGLLQSFSENREVQIGREEFRLFCNDLGSRLLVLFSKSMEEFEGVYNPGLLEDHSGEGPMLKVTDLGLKLLNFVKDHKKNDEKEVDKK